MTRIIRVRGKKVAIVEAEKDGVCELCGKKAETRPYGPKGENICFGCGMKDEDTTKKMCNKVLFEEDN